VFKEKEWYTLEKTINALCHFKNFLIDLEAHVLMTLEPSSPNAVNYALTSSRSQSFLELFTTSVHCPVQHLETIILGIGYFLPSNAEVARLIKRSLKKQR
jgi:hypothetical protein